MRTHSPRARFFARDACTLIHDAPPPDALSVPPPALAVLPDIAGPELVVSENSALRAAIDAAFAEPDGDVPRWTQAVVVVRDGRLIGERYAPGIGIDTPLDGHSLAKSVVNALIGVLVREGRLDVRARADAPEWKPQDPRVQITLDNLMRMDAGFDFDEGKGAGTATYMWYTQDDIAHFAAQQPLVSPVGRQWHCEPDLRFTRRNGRGGIGFCVADCGSTFFAESSPRTHRCLTSWANQLQLSSNPL